MCCARLAQRRIGRMQILVRHVNFIGQFARKAHPKHGRRGDTDKGLAHGQPWERLAGPIAARSR